MHTFSEVELFKSVLLQKYPEINLSEVSWITIAAADDEYRLEVFYERKPLGIYLRTAYDEAYFI